MKNLAIISPVYNEEESLSTFCLSLLNFFDTINNKYICSVLFVLDGCTDRSLSILLKLSSLDSRIRIITLSKRFGHQNSLVAGMDNVDADVVIMMDSDMQHPPKFISELLNAYESGFDVVHATRNSPMNHNILDKIISNSFYYLFNLISDVKVPKGGADFRLISKKILNIFKLDITEKDRFLRGLFVWVGHRQCTLHYDANPRIDGKSKFDLFRRLNFAFSGIVSFSTNPLKFLMFFGLLLSLLSFLFAFLTILSFLLGNELPKGWGTLVVIICLIGGIQIFMIGLVGQYIAAIYMQVKNRPAYIIERKINF